MFKVFSVVVLSQVDLQTETKQDLTWGSQTVNRW